MSSNKLALLRSILKAFGLSAEVVDDIVNWIADLLAEKMTERRPPPTCRMQRATISFHALSKVSTWC